MMEWKWGMPRLWCRRSFGEEREREKKVDSRERERERKRERGVSRRRAEDMSCGIKAKPCEIARKPRSFNKPGPAAVVRGGSWWILILIWNKSSLFRGSVNATRNATRRPGYETVGWKGKGGGEKKSRRHCARLETISCPDILVARWKRNQRAKRAHDFVSRKYEPSVSEVSNFLGEYFTEETEAWMHVSSIVNLSTDIPLQNQSILATLSSGTFVKTSFRSSHIDLQKNSLVNNDWRWDA